MIQQHVLLGKGMVSGLALNIAILYKKRPQQTLHSEEIHVFYCVVQAVRNMLPVCLVGAKQVQVIPGTLTNQSCKSSPTSELALASLEAVAEMEANWSKFSKFSLRYAILEHI